MLIDTAWSKRRSMVWLAKCLRTWILEWTNWIEIRSKCFCFHSNRHDELERHDCNVRQIWIGMEKELILCLCALNGSSPRLLENTRSLAAGHKAFDAEHNRALVKMVSIFVHADQSIVFIEAVLITTTDFQWRWSSGFERSSDETNPHLCLTSSNADASRYWDQSRSQFPRDDCVRTVLLLLSWCCCSLNSSSRPMLEMTLMDCQGDNSNGHDDGYEDDHQSRQLYLGHCSFPGASMNRGEKESVDCSANRWENMINHRQASEQTTTKLNSDY